ncbi:hypothetical protein QO230_00610 [Vibrio vulnificus]|uniref:hypothetical protein n=1 Tax=Vibrio vulnificus TaxID=672 RepID=UPI0024E02B79|nr:hypothetical protein [Vibrio vulnificus]MDK2606116.1 hypothetical protein [Vibrio vulnificus]MDK2609860.1 hypothetical protein [Vibrio vulnificus]MDK2627358.1 hypothetical protein [Vibrio vulnificus]MDK2702803.1 hypothetical protein [Vibrio vulnificus]
MSCDKSTRLAAAIYKFVATYDLVSALHPKDPYVGEQTIKLLLAGAEELDPNLEPPTNTRGTKRLRRDVALEWCNQFLVEHSLLPNWHTVIPAINILNYYGDARHVFVTGEITTKRGGTKWTNKSHNVGITYTGGIYHTEAGYPEPILITAITRDAPLPN